MSSNLPPGVGVNDLPGNRPEDVAWDIFHECIDNDTAKHGLTDVDARMAWELGIHAYLAARRLGCRFPHDVDEEGFLP